jgi:hypothetical protein
MNLISHRSKEGCAQQLLDNPNAMLRIVHPVVLHLQAVEEPLSVTMHHLLPRFLQQILNKCEALHVKLGDLG